MQKLSRYLSNSQQSLLQMRLSPSMQKSLQVLQMPLQELSTWIQEQIELNPFLEWDESDPWHKKTVSFSCDTCDIPASSSLFEHLLRQAQLNFTHPLLLDIATWIIGNLEPTGFFLSSHTSCPIPCSEELWLQCLQTIQQFDPIGVAAKDIQETFLIQLHAIDKGDTIAASIVRDDLNYVSHQDFAMLKKKHALSHLQWNQVLQDLRSLDPFPGHRFSKQDFSLPPPDLILEDSAEGTLHLEVIQPSPVWKKLSFSPSTQEEKMFCKEFQDRAKEVFYCLHKRASTLHLVASYLIHKQKSYLLRETDAVLPITARQISQDLGLHESTVTRTLVEKHLSCSKGIIPLKELLSPSLNGNISTHAAKQLLKQWIVEENQATPLSDQELVKKMQDIGVSCARRTIAKYRSILNIPSSRARAKKLLREMGR